MKDLEQKKSIVHDKLKKEKNCIGVNQKPKIKRKVMKGTLNPLYRKWGKIDPTLADI